MLGVDGDEHDGRDARSRRPRPRSSQHQGGLLAVAVDERAEQRGEQRPRRCENAPPITPVATTERVSRYTQNVEREPQEGAGDPGDERVDEQSAEDGRDRRREIRRSFVVGCALVLV